MNARYVGTFGLACGAGLALAGVALAVRDRHELTRTRRLMREAELRAHTDALTGLPNRAGLHKVWPHLAPSAPVVGMLDLDGFKPVNDTHGHAAGDLVLATIASRVRALPIDTTVARLGGDEFALILPGPMRQAHTQALHIAATVALTVPVADGVAVTVTASIGLASADNGDLAQALAAADAAMYRAKTSRTGIAVYDPIADERSSLTADPRPTRRVRDLTPTIPALMEVPA